MRASSIMSRRLPVRDMISQHEPSELVKASPSLIDSFAHGMSIQECERHARGAERLKEAFSSTPFYAQRAAEDPDYWNLLYDSRVNW